MKGDTNLTIIFVYVKETTVMPIFPMQNILFHLGDIIYLFLYTQGLIHSKYDIVVYVFSMSFFVLWDFNLICNGDGFFLNIESIISKLLTWPNDGFFLIMLMPALFTFYLQIWKGNHKKGKITSKIYKTTAPGTTLKPGFNSQTEKDLSQRFLTIVHYTISIIGEKDNCWFNLVSPFKV